MNTNDIKTPSTTPMTQETIFESLTWSEAEEHGFFEEDALSLDDVVDSNFQQEDDNNIERVHEHPERL